MESEKSHTPNFNEAMLHLQSLRARFASEGNVDSEFDQLANVEKRLLVGDITAKEAMEEGNRIAAGRIER